MGAVEQHYTVAQVAKMWGVSTATVRRLFRNEKGVLLLGNDETRYKRGYKTMLIPQSVLIRVHERFSR